MFQGAGPVQKWETEAEVEGVGQSGWGCWCSREHMRQVQPQAPSSLGGGGPGAQLHPRTSLRLANSLSLISEMGQMVVNPVWAFPSPSPHPGPWPPPTYTLTASLACTCPGQPPCSREESKMVKENASIRGHPQCLSCRAGVLAPPIPLPSPCATSHSIQTWLLEVYILGSGCAACGVGGCCPSPAPISASCNQSA